MCHCDEFYNILKELTTVKSGTDSFTEKVKRKEPIHFEENTFISFYFREWSNTLEFFA